MPDLSRVSELPLLPSRTENTNKGDYGRVLIIAGSRGMSGAAILCGSAALRAGAGLVFLAVPESTLSIVSTVNPCYLTYPMSEDVDGRLSGQCLDELLDKANACDVVAIGPGLSTGEEREQIVGALLQHVSVPMILDADALNVLPNQMEFLRNRHAPTVLTPHPGEFSRLTGLDISTIQQEREEHSVHFASENKVTLILKGNSTVVTDGSKVFINETGNPGMATGGTGDVLTGLIAALIGQGMSVFEAAQLSVYLHGLSGDLASEVLGEHSLIASDLIDYLPTAFQEHSASE